MSLYMARRGPALWQQGWSRSRGNVHHTKLKMPGWGGFGWERVAVLVALLGAAATSAFAKAQPTVGDLKARISSTSIKDRPHLCVEIAQKQLEATDKFYAGSDFQNAQTSLTDVVAYSELARDYAIQGHHYQKQVEIAMREMTRRLNTILHSLGQADQEPVKAALGKLQHARDDLLSSMFRKVRHD
jgi:hypothetical protein